MNKPNYHMDAFLEDDFDPPISMAEYLRGEGLRLEKEIPALWRPYLAGCQLKETDEQKAQHLTWSLGDNRHNLDGNSRTLHCGKRR